MNREEGSILLENFEDSLIGFGWLGVTNLLYFIEWMNLLANFMGLVPNDRSFHRVGYR